MKVKFKEEKLEQAFMEIVEKKRQCIDIFNRKLSNHERNPSS